MAACCASDGPAEQAQALRPRHEKSRQISSALQYKNIVFVLASQGQLKGLAGASQGRR
jgi:hypothetical protein